VWIFPVLLLYLIHGYFPKHSVSIVPKTLAPNTVLLTPAVEEPTQSLYDRIAALELQLSAKSELLRTRASQFNSMASLLHCGYWEWDEITDTPTYYTEQLADIFGIDYADIYKYFPDQQAFEKIVHPQDLETYQYDVVDMGKRFEDPKASHVCEYRIVRPNGEIRYLHEQEHGIFKEGRLISSYGVVHDVTDANVIHEELRISEQRSRELFDQLPVGAQVEDYSSIKKAIDQLRAEGVTDIQAYLLEHPDLVRQLATLTKIINVNQALMQMHGATTTEEFIEEEDNIDEWWKPHWVGFYAAEFNALCEQKVHISERVDTRVDGSAIETRSVTSVVAGYESNWKRVITIHEDITARKQFEKDLIEARNQAETASAAKSEFLSSMSHELRTPLNAILGFSQLFEYDKSANRRQLENAQEINSAGKHLLTLIDQVLDLSKIESGRLDLSMEPVSLWHVLQESISWVEPLAKNHGIKLNRDIGVDAQQNVQADAIRLKQIFLNLLSNAIKYNRQGGTVSVVHEHSADGRIRVGIRDTGTGLSDELRSKLFQPFNRLGAEYSLVEGTGIGLVITRQLANLMHGELDVESRVGVGSTFWVTLETADAPAIVKVSLPVDNTPITRSPSQARALRILVAEDNTINRELMSAQLEALGYVAEYVENGALALLQCQQQEYDLLLTDIRMPVMDGYQLIDEIRRLEVDTSRRLPIVAVTANALEGDLQKYREIGADDVISKPVELELLRRTIKKWGEACKVEHEVEATVEEVADPTIDLSVLQRATGNKPDLHRHLLSSFGASLPNSIDEIEMAFAWRSDRKIANATHKLKSSARGLGAIALGDLCEEMEQAARASDWSQLERLKAELAFLVKPVANFIDGYIGGQVIQNEPDDAPVDTLAGDAVSADSIDDESEFSMLRVLVIDDDYIMHRTTSVMLNDLGVSQVQNAMSGDDGLEIVRQPENVIDVIFCDLNMPGMDGVEFIRHLAKEDYNGSLVLMSGEDVRILKTVEKLAYEHHLNVLGVLEKPPRPAHIRDLLETIDLTAAERTVVAHGAFSVAELRRAIEQGELDTYFQPKIEISSGKVVGVESLVRWNHPEHGLVRPDTFITMAEETGLINALTDAVCMKTLDYAVRLGEHGYKLNTAINISVDTLNDLEWPDRVSAMLAASRLDPSSISFEITESRLMEQLSVGLDILSRLSLKRFKLSIDDFGTGYSSMEQLQRIPFNELKIDRAFVHGVANDSSARAILESSVLLANKLNIVTVAEGVEDQQDWDVVAEMGCDQVQGYFVCHPLPFDQLLPWLESWKLSDILVEP
jgi:EAL domain-containing protein (putative c-di-GMP-specific phosphodiesterase class I)/signal transduction histidine kinase/CheY-like chemotaxis protein/HPt (histidine-containing phosphotransfer) domain-containing protein